MNYFLFVQPLHKMSDGIIVSAKSCSKAISEFYELYPDLSRSSSFLVLSIDPSGMFSYDSRFIKVLPKKKR